MKKWVWSISLAIITWAVGLKFSPEETVWGAGAQLRFEAVSLFIGGFIGLMFGLVATKRQTLAEERRKFLYSTLGCTLLGLTLTFGPSLSRMIIGCVAGAVVGVAIATANYVSFERRFRGEAQ